MEREDKEDNGDLGRVTLVGTEHRTLETLGKSGAKSADVGPQALTRAGAEVRGRSFIT